MNSMNLDVRCKPSPRIFQSKTPCHRGDTNTRCNLIFALMPRRSENDANITFKPGRCPSIHDRKSTAVVDFPCCGGDWISSLGRFPARYSSEPLQLDRH